MWPVRFVTYVSGRPKSLPQFLIAPSAHCDVVCDVDFSDRWLREPNPAPVFGLQGGRGGDVTVRECPIVMNTVSGKSTARGHNRQLGFCLDTAPISNSFGNTICDAGTRSPSEMKNVFTPTCGLSASVLALGKGGFTGNNSASVQKANT
jgi:hypothetical protein